MQVGLFGGTFNPVHLGHLKVAKEVQESFDLDKIVFIPSSIPPHKEPEGVISAKDRFEMTSLAVSDYPDFKEISMGMTGDYILAIEKGSTMIRVGTLLFGSR